MPHPRSVRGAAALLQRTGRWLEAPPEAVVALEREESLRPAAPSPSREAASLGDALAGWAAALARARRVALVRRALLLACFGAALLLLLRVLLGAPPLLGVAAVAVVVCLVAVLPLLRRRPSERAVARLLDRRLGLHETVATAWELEERARRARDAAPRPARDAGEAHAAAGPAGDAGQANPLVAQVVADGERLVREARATTRVRPAPARGEWSLLAGGVAAVAALALVGGSGDSSSGSAPVRADAGSAPGSTQPTGTTARPTPSAKQPAPAPPATATTPAGTPHQPGASPGTSANGAAANGRTPADGSIAIRRQPARASDGAATGRGRGGARGAAGAGAGANGRSGTGAGSTAGRRTQSSVAPQPAASLPAPSQVKEFAAEGRRATAPLAGGAPSRSSGANGAQGAARSGTRGAGSQTGRSGRGSAARPVSGASAERLPLRLLSTAGGDQRAGGAGRASTGGSGRGAGRVQAGVTGTAGGGPLELPFVPPTVNAVAPYLRALVAAYFPPR